MFKTSSKTPNVATQHAFECLERQFSEYASGKRKKFDLKSLGLHSDLRELEGTDLQKRVWLELLKIPYGKVLTYSELAQRVGNPKAVRAVASAVASNPLYIVIPCHRVVPKSPHTQGETRSSVNRKIMGKMNIGNYALGKDMKSVLLSIEGVI